LRPGKKSGEVASQMQKEVDLFMARKSSGETDTLFPIPLEPIKTIRSLFAVTKTSLVSNFFSIKHTISGPVPLMGI
jgi:hypothetical protein